MRILIDYAIGGGAQLVAMAIDDWYSRRFYGDKWSWFSKKDFLESWDAFATNMGLK